MAMEGYSAAHACDIKKGEEEEKSVEKESEEEEIWMNHYCSSHQILLVGEGDFSFSLSLANAFGSASNILASSLDSYDVLIKKYKEAESNLKKLEHLGASLLHGLDATKMKLHTDLRMRRFDRIIFNFPHAGFHGKEDNIHVIKMHRNLVHGFFRNASGMLRADGEIHVNHKTSAPFNHWNLEELAAQNSLALIGCVDFKIADYPGYNNKRGASLRCDEPFPLGECSTFKFIFSPTTKKMPKAWTNMGRFQHLHETPIQPLQKPIYYEPIQPQTNFTASMNHQLPYVWSPQTVNIRNDCCRIFHGYHNHIMQTFGRTDCDLYYSVHDALKSGFDRYMTEVPGRDLNGYIQLLEELRRLSIMRLARLQMMLGPDHRL